MMAETLSVGRVRPGKPNMLDEQFPSELMPEIVGSRRVGSLTCICSAFISFTGTVPLRPYVTILCLTNTS